MILDTEGILGDLDDVFVIIRVEHHRGDYHHIHTVDQRNAANMFNTGRVTARVIAAGIPVNNNASSVRHVDSCSVPTFSLKLFNLSQLVKNA